MKEMKLKEGDTAPGFTAPANGGGVVSLSQFRGQSVVLYFIRKTTRQAATRRRVAFAMRTTKSRPGVQWCWV